MIVPRLGAWIENDTTHFRALTDARSCAVRLYGDFVEDHALLPDRDGVFALALRGAREGTLYRFVLGENALPDPYARFLALGVHGPAMVVESRYAWRFPCVSRSLSEQVIYELHVGTFTSEGTYSAALSRLPDLVELGITTIELMPLSAFHGARGWGYDGVAHFAPFAGYGTPDELRAFVDAAHELGLSMLLDVVYNHFGPSGNYLAAYDGRYFTRDDASPWGDAPNFSFSPMRRYVVDNALFWLTEFRFDGLRLDATHALVDRTPKHVLRELAEAVASLEPKRLLVAEDDRNDPTLVTELGLDALWADDFHHATRVTLTGERDGYYAAYQGGAAEIARTVRRGWLYEGQPNPVSGKARGANADTLSAEELVYCIQNHDQVGNRMLGDRLNHAVDLDAYLSVSLLLLFLPMTPLLFMGQEWASSSPFLYFTNHDEELGRLITEGRRREFASFRSFSGAQSTSPPDPQAPDTFRRSKLDWPERELAEHARSLELYRSALALRRTDPVLSEPSRERLACESYGEVLVVRRWSGAETRVLVVNFASNPARLSDLEALRDFKKLVCLLSSDGGASTEIVAPRSAAVLSGVR